MAEVKHGNFENAEVKVSGNMSQEGVLSVTITHTHDCGKGPEGFVAAMNQMAVGGACPLDPRLYCTGGNVAQIGLGVYEVSLTYTGCLGTLTTYKSSTSVTNEPIETHPKFVTQLAGTPLNPFNDAVFDETAEEASFKHWPADAPQNLGGVQEYLVPANQIVVVEVKPLSDGVIAWDGKGGQVGKKMQPPEYPVGTGDFLIVACDQEFLGGCTRITTTYKRSRETGWNSLIY